MAEHEVHEVKVITKWDSCNAECSCGWQGHPFLILESAQKNATDHINGLI